jgi:hypothetical protein
MREQKVADHKHGYQPGDIILRKKTDPRAPLEFIERKSPVKLKIGENKIYGENWTDANLHSYKYTEELFKKLSKKNGAPVASVDLEPQTMQMIIKKDPSFYEKFKNSIEKGYIEPVVTIPFHPIMPYLDECDQKILATIAFEIYKPLLKKKLESDSFIVGIWLPEGVYTKKTGEIIVNAFYELIDSNNLLKDKLVRLYFIGDSRQFEKPSWHIAQMSYNIVPFKVRRKNALETVHVGFFGRDVSLSDAFAFGHMKPEEIAQKILTEHSDEIKESLGIPYIKTLASDLEALLISPERGREYQTLIGSIMEYGIQLVPHSKFIENKLKDKWKKWSGEGETFEAKIREFSSWSDYIYDGHQIPYDDRWRGIRREDGRIIARHCKDRMISQIWKQGYLKAVDTITKIVSRRTRRLIKDFVKGSDDRNVEEFLINYHKIIFKDYYLMNNCKEEELEAKAIAYQSFQKDIPEETLIDICQLARAYYEILMGNKSCATFWENIDTRVTYQNIAFLSMGLSDLIDVLVRKGDFRASDEIFSIYERELINFEDAYERYNLSQFKGYSGWENLKSAWNDAIKSEVPKFSSYNIVKRSALYIGSRDLPELYKKKLDKYDLSQAVPYTGHIWNGEMHGAWDNPEYCEHLEN